MSFPGPGELWIFVHDTAPCTLLFTGSLRSIPYDHMETFHQFNIRNAAKECIARFSRAQPLQPPPNSDQYADTHRPQARRGPIVVSRPSFSVIAIAQEAAELVSTRLSHALPSPSDARAIGRYLEGAGGPSHSPVSPTAPEARPGMSRPRPPPEPSRTPTVSRLAVLERPSGFARSPGRRRENAFRPLD